MSHRAAGVLVIALIAAACAVEPIEDPGIGAGSLTSVVYAADGTALTEWHAGEDRVLVAYDRPPPLPGGRRRGHRGPALLGPSRRGPAGPGAGGAGRPRGRRGGAGRLHHHPAVHQERPPHPRGQPRPQDAGGLPRPGHRADPEQAGDLRALHQHGLLRQRGLRDRGRRPALLREGGLRPHPRRVGPARRAHPPAQRPRPLPVPQRGPVPAPDRAGQDGRARLAGRGRGRRRRRVARWSCGPRAPPTARSTPTSPTRSAAASSPSLPWATPRRSASRLLTTGGLRIYTTLDPAAQEAAEAAVASVIPEDGPSAALAAVDPRTGYVLALVGGADYYDTSDPVAQFNLATLGRRQPGSAFKPFALAAALQAGIGLDAEFQGGRSAVIQTAAGRWRVENYNQLSYPNLTLLEATVFSVNVVYARLMNLLDPADVVAVAQAAGDHHSPGALALPGPGHPGGHRPGHGLRLRHLRRRRAAHRPDPGDPHRGLRRPSHLRVGPHHREGHGARDRRAGDRRPHRGGAARHRPAGQDRPPGGRQDGHHRGPVRRLVRRLHRRDLRRRLGGLRPGRPPPAGALHPLHHHRRHLARPDLGPLRHRRPVGHPLPGPAPMPTRRTWSRCPSTCPPASSPAPSARSPTWRRSWSAPRTCPPSPAPSTTPRGSHSPPPESSPSVAGQRPGRGGRLARGGRLPGHRRVGRGAGADPRHRAGAVPGGRQHRRRRAPRSP